MSTWTAIGPRSWRAVQTLTDSAPSTTAEGVALDGVGAVVALVHAPAGQTFAGAGTWLGYIYSPLAVGGAAWLRSPRHDQDCSDLTGLADATLAAFPVSSPTGRFALVPSGITLSGAGTTVTTDYVLTGIRGEAL